MGLGHFFFFNLKNEKETESKLKINKGFKNNILEN
jgi:hypothetical protein